MARILAHAASYSTGFVVLVHEELESEALLIASSTGLESMRKYLLKIGAKEFSCSKYGSQIPVPYYGASSKLHKWFQARSAHVVQRRNLQPTIR